VTFAQLAFPLDGPQAVENGTCAPPALPGSGSRRGRPCGRCKALSGSPTAPDAGTICTSCRLAADRATRRCAVCGGPIDPGRKITTRYCSRRCKDRADEARAASRDHANGACHEPRRCQCERPILVLDDDLGEARCVLCGRTT